MHCVARGEEDLALTPRRPAVVPFELREGTDHRRDRLTHEHLALEDALRGGVGLHDQAIVSNGEHASGERREHFTAVDRTLDPCALS